jgi:hypothetical protein
VAEEEEPVLLMLLMLLTQWGYMGIHKEVGDKPLETPQ